MAILFFSLRGVPEDEAEDVRALLAAYDIAFYETSAGSWGVSMPAIWLYDEADREKILPAFDDYQAQRALTQRQLYLEAKRNSSGWGDLRQILRRGFYAGLLGLTAYVSVKWLFELGL